MTKIILLTMMLISPLLQAQEPPQLTPPIKDEDSLKAKGEGHGAIKTPKVVFVSPKDGATVKPKFKVKFKIDGMAVKPAGTLEAGTGHHHIIVDGAAIAKGQVVPKDEKNIHFGKGETSTELTLTP